jgi:hypothetical protein
MNIKDPGLRRTFEGMLNDGVIDKNEAIRMLQSVSDYGVVTQTEQADLLRILNELGDTMTPRPSKPWSNIWAWPQAHPQQTLPPHKEELRPSTLPCKPFKAKTFLV